MRKTLTLSLEPRSVMVNTGVSKTPASEAKDLGSNPSGAANRHNQLFTFYCHRNRELVILKLVPRTCASGGTAYTTDLKSVGESLRVQIPPRAPATKQVALPSFYDAFPPLKRHSFFGHTPLKWFYDFSNYMKIYISYFY